MRKTSTFIFSIFLCLATHAQTQVQFINNSSDSLMGSVKVLMNGDLKKDSLGFRKASSFISTSGDSSYTVTFQSLLNPAKSVSLVQTLATGKKYVFVLNGVTNDTTYEHNPDSISTQLAIVFIDQSLFTVPSSGQTTLTFVNGSTDAPAFDLYTNDTLNTLLVNNDSLNYVLGTTLPDTMIRLKLKTTDGGFNISTFLFGLTGLGGQTVTALTSGFLAPGSNKNGANFSVYLVDSSGNVISTLNVSLVKERNNGFENVRLFPNPASDRIQLEYTLSHSSGLSYTVFSANGDLVQNNTLPAFKGSNGQQILLPNLSPGIYFLQLRSEDSTKTVSFIIQ